MGASSLSPVPFSITGEASAGSSNNTDPCGEKADNIILLSNHSKVNQEPRDIRSIFHIVALTRLMVNGIFITLSTVVE